jgi:ribosome-binding ATPase YchF (GTP1/OBG family)
MIIGVVGAPNKGKSTFFSAVTMVDAAIANYPFTTIEPNRGIALVRSPCPHTKIGKQCTPKVGSCANGTRLIPIQFIDVAGLVPGAHEGRGLGNKFLDDLRAADAFIQVVDASGRTDLEGNPSTDGDPAEEVRFLYEELCFWMDGILSRNWNKIHGKGAAELADALTGLNISRFEIEHAASELSLPLTHIDWSDTQRLSFARKIFAKKPFVIVANKMDLDGSKENFEHMQEALSPKKVVPCSSAIELALRKAAKSGAISYLPGDPTFQLLSANDKQREVLSYMAEFLKLNNGTGVQQAVEAAVYGELGMIVVYPVEDEHHWCDNYGNVLPHAYLMPKGSTAHDLAAKVHTDLAKNFISAIDCKTKMHVGKTHALNNGDVIKIVAGR